MEEIQLNNLGGGSGASGAAIEQINVATFVADDKDGDGKKERDSWGSKVCCITENTLTLPSPFISIYLSSSLRFYHCASLLHSAVYRQRCAPRSVLMALVVGFPP